MAAGLVTLTGVERTFRPEEIIVSKTDTTGRITYANEVFQRVSGYREHELLGKPHNLIRHPRMPRCVFKLLWDTIGAGREIFAYVLNRARNGDEYWVLAHVTPTFDARGKIVSYHSNRRAPRRDATDRAAALYAQLLAEEDRHADRREAMEASTRMLLETLDRIGKPYDEFVFSL
jgi:PAS domain S-box-containing protein